MSYSDDKFIQAYFAVVGGVYCLQLIVLRLCSLGRESLQKQGSSPSKKLVILLVSYNLQVVAAKIEELSSIDDQYKPAAE